MGWGGGGAGGFGCAKGPSLPALPVRGRAHFRLTAGGASGKLGEEAGHRENTLGARRAVLRVGQGRCEKKPIEGRAPLHRPG